MDDSQLTKKIVSLALVNKGKSSYNWIVDMIVCDFLFVLFQSCLYMSAKNVIVPSIHQLYGKHYN